MLPTDMQFASFIKSIWNHLNEAFSFATFFSMINASHQVVQRDKITENYRKMS